MPGGTYYRTYNTADSLSGPPDGGWPGRGRSSNGQRVPPRQVRGDGGSIPAVRDAALRQRDGLAASGGLRQAHAPEWRPGARKQRERGDLRDGVGRPRGQLEHRTDEREPWRAARRTARGRTRPAARRTCRSTALTGTRRTPSASGTVASCRAKRSGSTRRREGASSASTRGAPTAPGTANQYAIYGCYYPSGAGNCNLPQPGVANIAPVGTATLGAGLWGQLDLAGNMWEWNLDSGRRLPICRSLHGLRQSYTRLLPGDPRRRLQQCGVDLAPPGPQRHHPDGPHGHRPSLRPHSVTGNSLTPAGSSEPSPAPRRGSPSPCPTPARRRAP